jgi:hypothetical protein
LKPEEVTFLVQAKRDQVVKKYKTYRVHFSIMDIEVESNGNASEELRRVETEVSERINSGDWSVYSVEWNGENPREEVL